jgi:hypothetical protein
MIPRLTCSVHRCALRAAAQCQLYGVFVHSDYVNSRISIKNCTFRDAPSEAGPDEPGKQHRLESFA